MYTITKEFRFEAAHLLENHDGKCARLHGHSYVGRIEVQADALVLDGPKKHMVVDYGDLKRALTPIIDTYLDHHYLNETLECGTTTAEWICKWLYHQLAGKVAAMSLSARLVAVEIDETCTSSARYAPLQNSAT